MSEFVEGGEIRHDWQCDNCGRSASTAEKRDELAPLHVRPQAQETASYRFN
jgi:hypothetical protein